MKTNCTVYQVDCYYHNNLCMRQWYKTKKAAYARAEKGRETFEKVTVKEVTEIRLID